VRASDATFVGEMTELGQAAGTWLTQTAWVPDEGRWLVAWFEGAVVAQALAPDGQLQGDRISLAPGYGAYDGFAFARHPNLGFFAAVFHGPTDEDWAAAFDAGGAQTRVIQATDSPGEGGHFNPRLAANSRTGEWMLVTSLGFQTVVGQRLGP
jgi:hypothetical protein